MKKIRVGVIGLGNISDMHVKSYLQNKDVEIVAFCDNKLGRAQEKADEYNLHIPCCEDYNQLLANPDVDAVSVCVWNNNHAQITIAALKAGKHVLCEKPPAITVDQAEEMKRTAEESGKILMYGFVRRFSTDADLAKSYIESGVLGDIYYAKTSCLRRRGNPGGWFSDKSRSGGGPLIDLGVHMIDLARYLMGKPDALTVSASTFSGIGMDADIVGYDWYKSSDFCAASDVEDMATAYIRFAGGKTMSVETSFCQNIEKDVLSLEIYGTKGGMKLYPDLKIFTKLGNCLADITPVRNVSQSFDDMFKNEINHFVECVQENKQTRNTPEDGVAIMKILNAVYKSAENMREIEL